MKKASLALLLLMFCIGSTFALERIIWDTSYEKCTSFEDPIKMSVGVEGEGYSVLISEYSIKKNRC